MVDLDRRLVIDLFDPTWLNLVFKSGADFGEGVGEVGG
jgi:hypothetical protein